MIFRKATPYNSTMNKTALILFLVLSLGFSQPAHAQADGPVYIVQPGDTLSFIASRFNVSLADVIAANPSIDPNLLSAGQEIVIPGLEGVSGVLETEIVAYGDTLRSLSRRTQVSDAQLKKLNRLISPTELYAGVSLILPLQNGQDQLATRFATSAGDSLLEAAVKQGIDPWTITSLNKRNGTWDILPGDVLYSPAASSSADAATGLPSIFIRAEITPLPLTQGGTEIIRVATQDNIPVTGMLMDKGLNFSPDADGQVALQGVHALAEPGVYPLRLEAALPDGSNQSFEQMVLVTSGNYLSEEIPLNDPSTLDPAVTEPELKNINLITAVFTPTRYWDGIFKSPAVDPNCFTSWYGTRRTYRVINSDIELPGFHSGLDFCGGEGLQIFAPAAGRVVFAAPLAVRGNATIIDHGWGVYSGFWHQSQMLVNVGDVIDQGQVIGLVGGTGRATGAHLHWEVWVNGVQVNPLGWLDQAYP
jgi:murein DD-endopeptidase MepM/ murein hydrolase activator NlpD